MKRKIFIITLIILVLCVGLFCFFTKNNYKTVEFGNTNIKSAEGIKEYILNLDSYEANIEIEANSNKTQNKYTAKQTYKAPNLARQEIIEPQSVKGLITSYDGNNLKIENTKLNLSKLYENYPYVADNNLWLSDFINDYKNSKTNNLKEEENIVIMQVKIQKEAKKEITKTLYIDKNTLKPTKLTIEDEHKKMLVYIQYNEIKINSSR
ncbi:MAG: hypothetical protein J6A04_01200 [Clostridia bacterium]|nr:hypothetical protein [Clostridia bacterium]